MELPIGKLASELIEEIEKAIKAREEEVRTLKGAIDGVKLMVGKIQEYADKPATEEKVGE